MIQQELTASVVTQALALLDDPDGDASARSAMASRVKSRASDAGLQVAREAVQLHGGMGVTNELPAAHMFKRLTMINTTLGDVDHHLARFASLPGFQQAA